MSAAEEGPVDVAIVGTGPAGLTAAAYAGRRGLATRLFERESIGGELVNRHEVLGYPGFPDGVRGTELRAEFVEAVEQYDVEALLAEVEAVEPGEPHVLRTAGESYEARTVVLATGGTPSPLGVPGEAEYLGRGIFDCAECDGPLYRDEVVAATRGNNHGLTDALYLAELAAEVRVYEPEPALPADRHLRERARSAPAIEIETGTEVVGVDGADGVLTGVRLRDVETGEERGAAVDGLYVHVGVDPNTGFVDGTVPLDDENRVVVDERLRTDVDGVFAAGDVRSGSPTEVAAAVGDGTVAIRSAMAYLDG